VTQPEAPDVDSLDWYAGYRALVGARLRAHLSGRDSAVYDLGRYHLGWTDDQGRPVEAESGKMLRPVLCLTACAGFGDPREAIDIAASLELLHSFSLVHDDIEDGDRERRHRATVWAQFGVPLAINAGDALFVQAFELLHSGAGRLEQHRESRALRLFTNACLRMIEGQHADMEFERRQSVSLGEYCVMIRGKTAALIGASVALGALAAGAENAAIDTLHAAGLELGIAFQAADDLLAYWGNPAETGKAVGNDLARGKKSLPLVFAEEAGLALDRLHALPFADALAELEDAGSRRRSGAFAIEHAERAAELIDSAGMRTEPRDQLLSLVRFAVSRVR
jgi:geranylgeranyl diphosphate synthase, type I